MGYRPLRRFVTVELPLSVPVLSAGVRVASVSNISLVSVGALIGVSSLGSLFTDGFRRDFTAEIVVGVLGTVVLALVFDLILVVLDQIQLGAIARRQHDGLAHGGRRPERRERFADLVRRVRDPLADIEGRPTMIDSDDGQRHRLTFVLRRPDSTSS